MVWNEYLTGTRHKCHVACSHQHCSHPQELVWDQVRFGHCRNADGNGWDYDRMLGETFYECFECKRPIKEEEKTHQLLHHREWRQTNFGQDRDRNGNAINIPMPRKMSAHLSDLYSNTDEWPEQTMGRLAVNYVGCRTTSARRSFRRGTLGLPVETIKVEKQDLERMLAMTGEFPKGSLPVMPTIAGFYIDVQEHGNVFKWAKLGFVDVSFDNASEDHIYVAEMGETDSKSDLIANFLKPITIVDELGKVRGREVRCQIGWIDEGDGFSTKTVLDTLLLPEFYRRLSSAKGRGKSQTESMTDRVMLQQNRFHRGRAVDRYKFDHDFFMDELYEQRIAKYPEIKQAILAGRKPPGGLLQFYKNPNPLYMEEFCSEKKDYHMRDGKLVFGWPLKSEGKNDFSDVIKEGCASWYQSKKIIVRRKEKRARDDAARVAEEARKGAEQPASS